MSIAEKLLTIAENEQKVYDAGYEKGKAEGGGGDTEAAFEAGRQAEWNKFWDTYQRKGNRTEYLNGFNGVGWGNESFYPKYDIICVGDASGLFRDWSTYDPEAEPLDLKARLDECNVALDTSGATRIHYLFAMTNFTRVPKVDLTSASQQAQAYQQAVFYRSYNLETIDGIKMNENNIPYNWFSSCNALKNVTITGTIGKNGFDIHYSTKLSKASILSILNACNKENAGVTITLPKKCIDRNQDTLAVITTDTELNTAYINATQVNNYTITFA